MNLRKTRSGVRAPTGFQGVFCFEQIPSSPSILETQIARMCGYRIDPHSIVLPIWRRHHG